MRFTLRKRKARKAQAPASGGRTPAWWVRTFLAVGRPLVVLIGLGVLAPAERHLAVVAGYGQHTSWGVAALVSAYGGMAALTAAYVDRSHPDRPTALWGAVGALASGSLSQVFAHLIATGHISVEPRPNVLLVILPSVAPVLIVGHVLHLSWVKPGQAPQEAPTAPTDDREPLPAPEVEEAHEHPGDELLEIPHAGLVTYAEAAVLTGRREATVRGWAHQGYIPGGKPIQPVTRDGKQYLRREDLPGQPGAMQPRLEAVSA